MNELHKFFARRYSAVQSDDEQPQQYLATDAGSQQAQSTPTPNINPVSVVQQSNLRDTQSNSHRQSKSFKSLGSTMNPAGILNSFFNDWQQNKHARSPKCAFLLLAIGVLAITIAVLVKIFHPYDLIFKWKLTMEKDGEIFNLWEKPPVDLYIKIYLFNITNAEAFLAGRERLNVEQVGPYVYKEIMTHENVTFNPNGTMSTNPSHPLVWQEDLSEGRREDDSVVMLNIAMLAIAHLTANKSYFIRMAMNTLFLTSKSQPIVRMTAKEFMFGFPSSLTTLGNTFLPNWIHFEKVGLIDRMYDFNGDFETFHTGVTNPGISGLYATYRGSPNLPQWDGEHCSNIELASDGTKFQSFLSPNDSVKFFRKSMCRPIKLHRVGEEQQHGSLSGYRYVFEENAFDNGANNSANQCFCRKGYCQPQGLIDVTDCYYGFPISLSYPHFMDGDIGLQNNITGVMPNKDLHSSSFVIQPESGLPLSISAKVQINMHFNELRAFHQVTRFSHLTVPMLWFDIMMPQLPPSLDSRFNFYLNLLPYLDVIGFWGGLLLGVALLVYAVTRATIRMSTFAQANGISTIHTTKFNKTHIQRPYCGTDSVYNACELTLLHTTDEKLADGNHTIKQTPNDQLKLHSIGKNSVPNIELDAKAMLKKAKLYMELDMEKQRKSLELNLEPVFTSTDDEDNCNCNNSETATLSHNSTSTSTMGTEPDGSHSQHFIRIDEQSTDCSKSNQSLSQNENKHINTTTLSDQSDGTLNRFS